jgi:hemerythrin
MLCEWNDKFRSKNKMIDEQHRKFFIFAKKLREMDVSNDQICDVEHVMELVKALYNHAYNHFKSEEQYAVINRYDNSSLIRHKIEHSKFLSNFLTIDVNQIKENPTKSAMQLAQYTTDWITNHILEEDLNMVSKV